MNELATLGGGCFWCLEAYFLRVKGIISVVSGYAGGTVKSPTYEQVCNGTTGHAEVVQLKFDPKIISYREILEIFFVMHDPTTLNRQGNDVGDQYRSVIFYHSEDQKKIANEMIEGFAARTWKGPIVTQLLLFKEFYAAENYHQDFYNRNPNQGYCMMIIDPKFQKLRQKFAEKLKD